MEDTDFDSLCDGVPPHEAKRLRKMLNEWSDGNEDSFPAQLALLTRAQWRAAAETPVVLRESLQLLQMKLAEYGQQTATLLKNFNNVADTKTKAIEGVIIKGDNSARKILGELDSHIREARNVVNEIQSELGKNIGDLQRMKGQFIEERTRLETARCNYESRKDWMDWVTFILLLMAMIAIGFGLGSKWR